MTAASLREVFGGKWDGGGREIHGIVQRAGTTLKIELLRASNWCCSIFVDGECVATHRADDAEQAVHQALAAWNP